MNYKYLIDLIRKYKERIFIKQFVNSKVGFNRTTPLFIRNNIMYQKMAITRNIDSIKYIDNYDNLRELIINEARRQEYILKNDSPDFLKRDYQVVKASIYRDINSSNYVDWDNLIYYQKMDVDGLINDLINNNFVLSSDSEGNYLADNERIIWSSIKKDINSFSFVNSIFLNNKEIFEYLVLNNYDFNIDVSLILQKNLSYFQNPVVTNNILKQLDIYLDKDNILRERFNSFVADFLITRPLIKDFNEIFMVIGEKCWDKYRKKNLPIFENLFSKTCSALRREKSFDMAYSELPFLNQVEMILEKSYQNLFASMKEFHRIYHNNLLNKKDLIDKSRNEISKLLSLYVSKSKEKYLKIIENDCYDLLRNYFILNKNNDSIKNYVLYHKKKDLFLNLYLNHDKDVNLFLGNLVSLYQNEINRDTLLLLISNFVRYNYSKLNDIILPYDGYYEYERRKKALKIFHRLQKGYISYNSNEAVNFHDLIKFNQANNTYLYDEKIYSEEEIKKYEDYNKLSLIFNKIKRSIIEKINSLDMEIDYAYDFNNLEYTFPFNDEYYVFDDSTLRKITLEELLNDILCCESVFFDSFNDYDSLKNIYNIYINKNILWFMIMIYNKKSKNIRMLDDIGNESFRKVMNHMKQITDFAKTINLDIQNINNLFLMSEIVDVCEKEDLLVLGPNNIFDLCKNDDFTRDFHDKTIKISRELILQMTKRNVSTVPYINGNYLDYHYSMYDSQDDSILFSGIKTDSCFRIDGNDNDFMHYCALDKNGFIIKITNKNNELIARASGFRNGNCVFINQLRTIYDHFNSNILYEYKDERKEIISVFKKACDDIIDISKKNHNEKDKIDFIFANKSYILEEYNVGFVVSDEINFQIGDSPMDNTSEDWVSFVNNTKNILDTDIDGFFDTDYGMYPIILVSHSSRHLTINNMIYKNVPALYKRKRNRIVVSKKSSNDLKRKINKIHSAWCFFQNKEFSQIYIPDSSIIIIGDNWFIICKDSHIIDSCVLDFDEDAIKEYDEIKKIILHSKNDEMDIIKKLSYKK